MAEYKAVSAPFRNKGVVQKVDPSQLGPESYAELSNVFSLQEGALSARFGATRFSGLISGTNAHTIGLLRLGPETTNQYFYVGEGADIYRIRKSAPSTVTAMSLPGGGSLPSWGQRWTSNTYKAGQSGKAWMFIAASQMLKDDVSSTTFERWGILPPPNAPTVAIGTQYSKVLDDGSPVSNTWGADGFDTLSINTGSVNMGQFSTPSTAPSGKAANHYDSEDYIELTMTLSTYANVTQILLQFDCNDGSYNDYYEKTILQFGVDPSTATPSVRGTAAFMPPSSGVASEVVTVQIKKNTFLKVGSAGTGSTDWSTVTDSRALIQAKNGDTVTISNLNLLGGSGPDNSASGRQPYQYRYTYRNDATAHESNPSVPQIPEAHLASVSRQPVALSNLIYSTDPQVTSIAVYRAGGQFTDGEFRLIGYTPNNSAGGTTTFSDTLLDSDIANAKIMEIDNDPPVLSTLPTALNVTFTGAGATGLQTVTLSESVSNIVTVGTTLHVSDNDKTEDVRVVSVSGANVGCYFQNVHSGTIRVTCEAVTGVPCRLSVIAGESVYLAGDQNNPHVLYKSKSGRPEAFPVITEASGVVNQIIVGSQSNPIMALTEFGGDVVCLNLRGIYIVRTINGQMLAPQETPASHGLISSFAWCKADGELFYLSNDGVYSWYGGREEKRSEEIDWFFKGTTINGRKPLDMGSTGLQYVRMEYYRDELWIIGLDTDAVSVAAIYDTVHKRWSFRSGSKEGGLSEGWYTSILATSEGLFTARNVNGSTYLYEEWQGTTDNSSTFPCVIHTGFFNFDSPTLQKQFGDVALELTSDVSTTVTVKTYYDYSASVDETLTVAGAAGRRTIPIPIQSGNGKEARAVAFRFEFTSSASTQITLHSLTFNVLTLADIQRGRASDWNDYGYPHDKRLDQLVIDYDTGGTSVTLNLDTISGIAGNTQTSAVATFTLTGSGRSQATLPVKKASDGTMVIAKKIRLRPTATTANFKIFDAQITYEKYPPDVTLFTDPEDAGSPFDKAFTQLILDADTGGIAATVDLYLDGSSSADQSLTVNTTATTRQQTLTLTNGLIGKKARMVFTPGTNGKFQLFSYKYVTVPYDKGPVMHTSDWMDLGHPYDKRLYTMSLEYQVASDTSFVLEGLSGIGSAQTSSTLQTFTLKASTRKVDNFAITGNPVVKAVRFKPTTPAVTAKIYKVDFQKEDYPPDYVAYTPTEDCGTPYDKYFNQLDLDIDTGGVAATVQVEIDGSVQQTLTVNSTATTRNKNFTLNPVLVGKRARLLLTSGTNGKTQLFNHQFIVTNADDGAVKHSFNWDNLGHPYDKRLRAVTFRYDNMSAGSTTMLVDTLTGTDGTTVTNSALMFTLSGATRGEQTFPIADGTIVKAVRVHPSSDNTSFKHWGYVFDFEKLPADKILFTPWDSLNYPCEKVLRSLILDIDTGGVACSVELQADGVTKETYTVTTTANDRVRILSCASDIADSYIIGREFRLKFTPGNGGKAQYFTHTFEQTHEPCPATHWDSFEQTFGSAGYRFLRQCWVEFRGGSCVFKIYRDDGTLFYQKTLPAHTQRTTERFYLPAINNSVLNKAKGHRIVIDAVDATKPFYLYRDSSRLEIGFLSAGARAPHQQSYLWSTLPIQK